MNFGLLFSFLVLFSLLSYSLIYFIKKWEFKSLQDRLLYQQFWPKWNQEVIGSCHKFNFDSEELPVLLCSSACYRGKQRGPRERENHQTKQKTIPALHVGFQQQTAKIYADESKTESQELQLSWALSLILHLRLCLDFAPFLTHLSGN